MSGDPREVPSNKLVVDPSPRAIREGGSSEFLVGCFLEKLPSDICLVLVSREKPLEGFESGDTKGGASRLVFDNVLREGVLVPRFPEVARASRASKENGDLGGPSFSLVVFELGNPQSGGSRSEVDASELKVKMKPTLEVEKVFGDNPLTRARGKEAVGSGLGGKDIGRRRNELPEKAQDREAENVIESTFTLEANVQLAVRSASANKF